LGPQEVVEKWLRSLPGEFYRPREWGKKIQDSGYAAKRKKPEIWFAQVTNCLRRAEAKGIAEMREIGGKKTYGLKFPEQKGVTDEKT
jgi:hypothetical protein